MTTPNAIEAATDAQIDEIKYIMERYDPVEVQWSHEDMAALIARIEQDAAAIQPVSVNPLCWVYEDELPKSLSSEAYDALYPHSKVDGVRLFPIYGPSPITQPAHEQQDSVTVQPVGYRYWDNAEECWLLCGTDPAQLCENNVEYSKPEPLYSQAAMAELEADISYLNNTIVSQQNELIAAYNDRDTAKTALAEKGRSLERLLYDLSDALGGYSWYDANDVRRTPTDMAIFLIRKTAEQREINHETRLTLSEFQKREAGLREFAESFHITVCADSFYKDVSLHLDTPHSFAARLRNDSTKSWIFADLEARRVAALTPKNGEPTS